MGLQTIFKLTPSASRHTGCGSRNTLDGFLCPECPECLECVCPLETADELMRHYEREHHPLARPPVLRDTGKKHHGEQYQNSTGNMPPPAVPALTKQLSDEGRSLFERASESVRLTGQHGQHGRHGRHGQHGRHGRQGEEEKRQESTTQTAYAEETKTTAMATTHASARALRLAHETREVGARTLAALADQANTIDRCDAVLEDTTYDLERARRTVRGMGWWGRVQNWFTRPPQRHDGTAARQQERAEAVDEAAAKYPQPRSRPAERSQSGLTRSSSMGARGPLGARATAAQRETFRRQSAGVGALRGVGDELLAMAQTMGCELDRQHRRMDDQEQVLGNTQARLQRLDVQVGRRI